MRFAALGRIAIVVLAALVMPVLAASAAQNTTVDRTTSNALTRYLHKHRLPLVAGQVSAAADGSRQVVLYGFVATDFGKQDAEKKARHYLHDPGAVIINHIKVDPSIRHLKKATPPQPDRNAGQPPTADWERSMDNLLREGGATPSNDPNLNMPPLPRPGSAP